MLPGGQCNRVECYSTAGDGWMTGDEKCDDGNTVSGDGCPRCQS